jgi:hypothetical protein
LIDSLPPEAQWSQLRYDAVFLDLVQVDAEPVPHRTMLVHHLHSRGDGPHVEPSARTESVQRVAREVDLAIYHDAVVLAEFLLPKQLAYLFDQSIDIGV